MSTLLTGCVAAVLAGSAISGMIVYDKRSMPVLENDTRIYYQIHKNIVSDTRFRRSHIEVISFNQVVLLVGETPVASLRVMAEKLAQNTYKVKRVYNEIKVQNPITIVQRSKDTWITGQIRSVMLTKKGLESGSIRVVTCDGIVYLMGIVTHEQANVAVNVARQINGVRKVVKVFQYMN
jgi:osmotically-inducible protein OsmY